jgi:hypothetical protein
LVFLRRRLFFEVILFLWGAISFSFQFQVRIGGRLKWKGQGEGIAIGNIGRKSNPCSKINWKLASPVEILTEGNAERWQSWNKQLNESCRERRIGHYQMCPEI